MVIWACLDNLVPSNGNRSLVGLAESRLDGRSDAILPAAIVVQCDVVCSVLWTAVSWSGFYRNCHVVVRHSGDDDRILDSSSGRRLVVFAIFDLG